MITGRFRGLSLSLSLHSFWHSSWCLEWTRISSSLRINVRHHWQISLRPSYAPCVKVKDHRLTKAHCFSHPSVLQIVHNANTTVFELVKVRIDPSSHRRSFSLLLGCKGFFKVSSLAKSGMMMFLCCFSEQCRRMRSTFASPIRTVPLINDDATDANTVDIRLVLLLAWTKKVINSLGDQLCSLTDSRWV